jgi:hypothetical protein
MILDSYNTECNPSGSFRTLRVLVAKEERMRTIREGDMVSIYYSDGEVHRNIKVVHTPCDVGDLWYFEDEGGTFALNVVSANFEQMRKEK